MSTEIEYNAKDLLWASITKTLPTQNAGLHLIQTQEGKIQINRVDGIFEMFTEVKPGYILRKFQGKVVEDYESIDEIRDLIQNAMRIEIEVLKPTNDDDSQPPSLTDISIAPGDIMKLKNMTLTPDMNGELIKIKRAAKKQGRWLVQVSRTREKLMVEMENLLLPQSENEAQENIHNWIE